MRSFEPKTILARVTEITKQTLKFYRDPVRPSPTDVGEILESVLQLYHSRIVFTGISVDKRISPLPRIIAGSGELRQLFANLIGNAIDATRGGGRLRIHARHCSGAFGDGKSGVRVTIADTGTGIPAHLIDKIFEPFVTTKGDTGTGLGLWVVSELLQKHGGTIRVRSSTNENTSGTIFSVFLPDVFRLEDERADDESDEPAKVISY